MTSQMKILVRRMYSSPPINGSRIVTELLSDPQLKAEWLKDVKGMADRYEHSYMTSTRQQSQVPTTTSVRSRFWHQDINYLIMLHSNTVLLKIEAIGFFCLVPISMS